MRSESDSDGDAGEFKELPAGPPRDETLNLSAVGCVSIISSFSVLMMSATGLNIFLRSERIPLAWFVISSSVQLALIVLALKALIAMRGERAIYLACWLGLSIALSCFVLYFGTSGS